MIEKKPVAWVLTAVSAIYFVRNLFEADGPTNTPLGTFTLAGFIGGCVWLWEMRKEDQRELRRFIEETRRRDEAARENKDPPARGRRGIHTHDRQ